MSSLYNTIKGAFLLNILMAAQVMHTHTQVRTTSFEHVPPTCVHKTGIASPIGYGGRTYDNVMHDEVYTALPPDAPHFPSGIAVGDRVTFDRCEESQGSWTAVYARNIRKRIFSGLMD